MGIMIGVRVSRRSREGEAIAGGRVAPAIIPDYTEEEVRIRARSGVPQIRLHNYGTAELARMLSELVAPPRS